MQINEQELAEAVERLREGDDNGLLVKQEEVLLAMYNDPYLFSMLIIKLSEYDNNIQVYFDEKFDKISRDLLIKAAEEKDLP